MSIHDRAIFTGLLCGAPILLRLTLQCPSPNNTNEALWSEVWVSTQN